MLHLGESGRSLKSLSCNYDIDMKNVLITGGDGFVGRQLVQKLKVLGHKIVVWDLSTSRSVLDSKGLETACLDNKIDTIYHLAAVMGTGKMNDFEPASEAVKVNVNGTLNVLEAARIAGAKVIYLGKPNAGWNTYSVTKVAAQGFCEMYHKEHKVPVVVFIGFNIYGEGQPGDKMIPRLIKKAIAGEDITVFGDGEQTVDLIYNDDVAISLVKGGEVDAAVGKVIELGSGVETTVNETAEMIIKLTDSNSKVLHLPMRSGETPGTKIHANTTLLKEVLGITPSKDHVKTLQKTVAYYKSI